MCVYSHFLCFVSLPVVGMVASFILTTAAVAAAAAIAAPMYPHLSR
jgi:hypothetical protein